MNRFAAGFFPYIFTGICSLLLVNQTAFSQQISLSGTVKDASNGDPISYVTISIPDKSVGAYTDSLGRFLLKVNNPGPIMRVALVGYEPQQVNLNKEAEQHFTIRLKPETSILGEVTISADPHPGKTLIKKVIARKPENDPYHLNTLAASAWSTSEISLTNSNPDKLEGKNNLNAQMFRAVKATGDTTDQSPLYFAETLSDYYYQKKPFTKIMDPISTHTLGMSTDRILEQLAVWDFNVNLYDNWLNVFYRDFASPISDGANNYYDYYITDTVRVAGKRLIQLHFVPKDPEGKVFLGDITIEDSTYAVTDVVLILRTQANMNYIRSIKLHQSFACIDNQNTWALVRNKVDVEFESGWDLLGIPIPSNPADHGLVYHGETVFSKLQPNIPERSSPAGFGGLSTREEVQAIPEQSAEWWAAHRPDTLSSRAQAVLNVADSLQGSAKFRAKNTLLAILGTGYYDLHNKVRLGPYASLFSYNVIEGNRSRMGFTTLPGFNKNTNLHGYLAYGFQDTRVKYGIGIRHIESLQPWRRTVAYVGSDYDAIVLNYEDTDEDNLFNSLLRKNVPFRKTLISQVRLSQDWQLAPSWYSELKLLYRNIDPSFDFQYPRKDYVSGQSSDSTLLHNLPVAEGGITLRFAWREKTYMSDFERKTDNSPLPIVHLQYAYGFEMADAKFSYHRVGISLRQELRLPPKGTVYYMLSAGKVYGTLPYLLLYVPTGNDSYVTSRVNFNTMIPYEFAADRYVSLRTKWYWGGLLFDRIPGLKKLGWRERLTFNAFWGDLSKANVEFNQHTALKTTGRVPFAETGIGVENIFHMLSIDYIVRLTHLDTPDAWASKGGIFVGIKGVF